MNPDRESANALTDGAWVMGPRRVLVWVPVRQAIEQDRADVHLLIACPTCHARASQHCRTRAGKRRHAPHITRLVVRRCACGGRLSSRKQLCDECRAEARRDTNQRRSSPDYMERWRAENREHIQAWRAARREKDREYLRQWRAAKKGAA